MRILRIFAATHATHSIQAAVPHHQYLPTRRVAQSSRPLACLRLPVAPRAGEPTERRLHPDKKRRDVCATRDIPHGLTAKPSVTARDFCRASKVKNSVNLSFLAKVTCSTSRLRQPMRGPWMAAHCAAAR